GAERPWREQPAAPEERPGPALSIGKVLAGEGQERRPGGIIDDHVAREGNAPAPLDDPLVELGVPVCARALLEEPHQGEDLAAKRAVPDALHEPFAGRVAVGGSADAERAR